MSVKRNILLSLGILFLGWTAVGYMNRLPARPKAKSYFIFPSTEVKRFTFGYNDILADSYWIRSIQDLICVNPKAPEDSPRTGPNHIPHCEMDWIYHMLFVITELTPRNYIAYMYGGTMLSVVLDDIKGATIIYEKGLATFPNDWRLNYQAATHLMSEVGDINKAAYYYNRAVMNGAPGWLAALSAKLFDSIGRTEIAILNLKAQLKRSPDEKFSEAVRRKLVELEDRLAKESQEARQKRNDSVLKNKGK